MKLKCSFEPVDMGDEIIAVPVGDGADEVHGVLKLNKLGMEIVNMLYDDISVEDILSKLLAKFKGDSNVLSKSVNDVIENLKANNLIVD